MSKPRKHHYVPEMLQRQFADPDGHMWFFDKTEAAFGVRRRPIARLLRELHLYTTVAYDGTRDTKTETELSKIESKAGPILEQIIQRARNGEAPQLTSSERETVSLFLIAQLRRTPEFFDQAIKDRDIKERLTDVLKRLEEARGQIPVEMKQKLLGARNLARMQSNLFAGGAAEPLFFSMEGMMLRGFTASIITASNCRFIIGSNPIVRLRGVSGTNGISDPTAEVWLPIAPDVGLCSYGAADLDQLVRFSEENYVQTINSTIAEQSNVIASASRNTIDVLSAQFMLVNSAAEKSDS